MPIESATWLSQLNSSEPPGSEPKSILDNHIRLLKAVLQNQFTSLGTAAVTKTAAELNSVTDRVLAAGGSTLSGTHDYSSATAHLVPTATAGDSSTKSANTAFVQAAIAGVNEVASLSYSVSSSTSITVSAGQVIAATNSSAVAATFPASPTVGTVCGIHFDNTRTDNTVDLGANSVLGWNGTTVSGLVTCDYKFPVILRWGGDYWRAI